MAKTQFRRLEHYRDAVWVEIQPFTGKTHQIRVHAAHLQKPLAGDSKYGEKEFNQRMRELGLKRLFLHARSLEFQLPGEARSLRVEAPLEEDLLRVLEKLRTMGQGQHG